MDDMLEFFRARLDEENQLAREASRDGERSTPTGEHWHWVEPEHDQVLALDPMLDDYLNDGGNASLRSVEEYPTSSSYTLPHFVVYGTEEMRTVDAMHIARWDPARVLALTAVLRRMVDEFSFEGRETAMLIELGAALYGDHPDWRDEWRGPSHVPTNEVLDMDTD